MTVDNFAILAFVDPIGIVTRPSGMVIFGSQEHGSPSKPLVDRVWNDRSDLQAGVEIYYWEHPRILAHFEQPKSPPFGTPISPPPCGQLAAPFLSTHAEPGANFKLYTQMKVSGLASYPVGHWPCPGRASHA